MPLGGVNELVNPLSPLDTLHSSNLCWTQLSEVEFPTRDPRYSSSTSTRGTLDEYATTLAVTPICMLLYQLSSKISNCLIYQEASFSLFTKSHYSLYRRHFQKHQVSCRECYIFSLRACIALLCAESCLRSLLSNKNFLWCCLHQFWTCQLSLIHIPILRWSAFSSIRYFIWIHSNTCMITVICNLIRGKCAPH